MITRDFINDDINLHIENVNGQIRTYTKKDLCEFIDFWKQNLISHGANRGDKIGFSIDDKNAHYYAILFAAFELGMKIVTLHVPTNEKECLTPKINAHLPLDFYIYLREYLSNPKTSIGIRHYRDKSKVKISYTSLEWQLNDTFRSTEQTPIWAEENDIAFCCTSSGTTGTPKLVTYTHNFLSDLCNWSWKVLEYDHNDRFLHLSSLNHGGVITLLLPALMICRDHYMLNISRLFAENCKKYGINRIFCAYGGMIDSMINDINLPDATIMLLSFISPRWKRAVEEGRLKKIVSVFGCTEICGPVFLMDHTMKPRELGDPTNGFYDTSIIGNRIRVNLPYGRQHVFDDVVIDNRLVSKDRLPKINDIDINPIDIIEMVEPHASRYNFEVYVDEVNNEVFVITSDEILYEMKESVENTIREFYLSNIPVTMIYDAHLSDAIVTHKADRNKLSHIVEKHLTIQKNPV